VDKKLTASIANQNHDTEVEHEHPQPAPIESKCLDCHVFETKCFENRFLATFEHAPICIAHTDLNGRFLSINKKFCDFVGYARDELMALALADITYAEDLHADFTVKERLIAGEIEIDIKEKRYIHKHGNLVWGNRTVSLLRDEHGNALYFIVMVEDISKRQAAQQQIKQANDQLQALYDASPDMIFVHAEDGHLVDVNQNTLDGYGFSREEMLALSFDTFCGKGYTKEMAADRLSRARRNGSVDFEWMARRKNGEEFPVEVRLRRLSGSQSANNGSIVALVRDISERKRTEHIKLNYMRRLEAMNKIAKTIESTLDYDTMLQNAIDVIRDIFSSDRAWLAFPCDPSAPTWSIPFESARSEFPGASTSPVDTPMDPGAADVFRAALVSEVPIIHGPDNPIPGQPDWQIAYSIKTQMTQAVHLKIGAPWLLGVHHCTRARNWTEEEQILFTEISHHIADALNNVLLHRDVKMAYKQLSETQSQLLQSEKLASIGQLAAGVAHEINNPVGYVSSNIASMQTYLDELNQMLNAYQQVEDLLPQDHPQVKQLHLIKQHIDLEFIQQDVRALIEESKEGVTRVKQIVQDLKDFSRADQVDWQWADLHHGLNSTLNIVWNELKYKADVNKEYGELPEIECIPSQLNQVFMNLLVNAAHAIEGHGTISIRTGVEDQARVWVEVADTGKGIAAEHLQKIFDPFFTTKPVGQGTGLGLSLAYGIVEKHNGKLTVKSEVGKGTVFRIILPIRPTVAESIDTN
jgi:PAS domain S-box-containing protein